MLVHLFPKGRGGRRKPDLLHAGSLWTCPCSAPPSQWGDRAFHTLPSAKTAASRREGERKEDHTLDRHSSSVSGFHRSQFLPWKSPSHFPLKHLQIPYSRLRYQHHPYFQVYTSSEDIPLSQQCDTGLGPLPDAPCTHSRQRKANCNPIWTQDQRRQGRNCCTRCPCHILATASEKLAQIQMDMYRTEPSTCSNTL